MCEHDIWLAYELMCEHAAENKLNEVRLPVVERFFGWRSREGITEDDRRNEPMIYRRIFSDDCRDFVEGTLVRCSSAMKGKRFEDCSDEISVLSFIQMLAAKARWVYRVDIGARLHSFAEDFDRIDDAGEQKRLYDEAQQAE